MDNTLLHVFLCIFLTEANNLNDMTVVRDPPKSNNEIKDFHEDAHTHQLSSDDRKKIFNFLKSFASPKKTPTSMKIIEEATGYCKSFLTCAECFKSRWYPCAWCHNYGCTDQPERLCPHVEARRHSVESNTTHEVLCPYIEHHGTILMPAGVRHNMQVKIHAVDPVLYDKEIICQLQFSNRVSHLKALILDDVVYCYPVRLDTIAHGETNMGFLRLIWGGAQPFSNRVSVNVYRCDYLADDCESCRLIPPEYGCGWCAEQGKCLIADKCADILIWNLHRLTCKSLGKKMFYV